MFGLKDKLICKSNKLLSGRVLEGCALYDPLWYEKLQGTTFLSLDHGHILNTVTGATWTPQGRSFDGADDYINIGRNASLLITGDLTITTWVKPDNFTASMVVVGQHEAIAGYAGVYVLFIQLTTGKIRIYRGNGVDKEKYSGLSTVGLTAGAWNFIAVKDIAGTPSLHVNDTVTDSTYSGDVVTVTDAGTDITIGKELGRDTNKFDGTIREMFVDNRALALSEIQNIRLSTQWGY